MFEGKIQDITLEQLQELIDNRIPEGKTIDYKRDKIGLKESEKKEFLQDITSFANAERGHLLLGVDEGDGEERGLPKSICGVQVYSMDEEKARIDNIIRDGIEPRLGGITIHSIVIHPNSPDRVVIVIRIPKSFNLPHMVKYQGHHTFYSRNSSGKYPLDVAELRNLFGLQESAIQWIRNFRIERLSKIVSGDTAVPLGDLPCVVLHIVPISAYNGHIKINISSADQRYQFKTISNVDLDGKNSHISRSQSGRHNFDGFITYAGYSPYSKSKTVDEPEYTQLFRNGIIEAVWTLPFHTFEDKYQIPSLLFEEKLIESVDYYISRIKSFEFQLPIYIMLSLMHVSNYSMVLDNYGDKTLTFDKDMISVPETVVTDYNTDFSKLMKEAFDIVWNSVGINSSIYYDEEGNRREVNRLPF